MLEDGVLHTVRRVFGCKYLFFFSPDGKLVIRELDPERGVELELLHGTLAGLETWGQDLPERLKRMHSHWYSREAGRIVLRPIRFNERSVQFVLIDTGDLSSDSDSYERVSPRPDSARFLPATNPEPCTLTLET